MSGNGTAIVRAYFDELLSKGDLARAPQILDRQFVFHNPAGDAIVGVKAFSEFVSLLRMAFPDLLFKIEDQFGAEDRIAVRFTMSGTHRGDLMGNAPTGRTFTVGGIDVFKVRAERILEIHACFDTLGQMRQLGIVG